jgi:hypothetical protein
MCEYGVLVDSGRVKRRKGTENCPSATLSTTNPTWTAWERTWNLAERNRRLSDLWHGHLQCFIKCVVVINYGLCFLLFSSFVLFPSIFVFSIFHFSTSLLFIVILSFFLPFLLNLSVLPSFCLLLSVLVNAIFGPLSPSPASRHEFSGFCEHGNEP